MTAENSRADVLTYEAVDALSRKIGLRIEDYNHTEGNDLLDFARACAAASPVEQPAAAPIDDFKDDTNSLIRSIMMLLEMDAAGVLAPHGIGGHGRKLLTAAAARLAAVPPHEPAPKQPRQLVAQSAAVIAPAPEDERAAFEKFFEHYVDAADEIDREWLFNIVRHWSTWPRASSAGETGAEGATWYDRWQAECTRDHGEYDENAPIADRLRWWVPKSARHGTILLEDDLREAADALSRSPAMAAEAAKSVATVRVTNGGYAMALSTYVAYALPEGKHDLYATPRPAQADARERLTDRFIAEFGHRLATLLGIDAFDIADRDAQLVALLQGANHAE